MLVTVRERTKEIGIRRALGATPRTIIQQIISESIVLTLMAGIAGLMLGVGLLSLVGLVLSQTDSFFQEPQISFAVALVSLVILLIIGTLAGLVPANRAMSEENTRLLFINFGDKEQRFCLPLLKAVRAAGINAEIFPEAAKIKKQMSYADSKKIPFVAIVGENEINANAVMLKNMLDAQWNFNHTAQNLGWLSNSDIKSIPQTIVVGIVTGGDRREHDLTPTPGDSHKGGGGDSLYRFIKEELIPFVEKNYRTYNYRLLGGVSYGGLFVMNAFVNDPLYFNGYLSLSPSMCIFGTQMRPSSSGCEVTSLSASNPYVKVV